MKQNNDINQKSKHNGIISFWKFMFAIMIVVYHFNLGNSQKLILKYGYIGVEFFFIVSGYFLGKKALNQEGENKDIGKDTFKYISGKIFSFFPYMLIAYIITLALNVSQNLYTKGEIINSIWNLLFLETSGIKTTLVIGQTWYISAMLLSMLIIYPLIRKYKSNFVLIVSPIIVIFTGGWISHNYGTVNGWMYTGMFYICLLRGFFEIALGTILYIMTEKIKKVNFTIISKFILTVIELCGFISIFCITSIQDAGTKYDFIMILILSISILLAFSEKTLFFNFSNNHIFYYLEKLSLPIYLNHNWIIYLVNKFWGNYKYFEKLGIIIIATIIFSMIVLCLINQLKKINKIKSFFIHEDIEK